MRALTFVIDIVLAGYVIREVVRFGPQYRQLKLDLAKGDTRSAYPRLSPGDRFRMGQRSAGAPCLGIGLDQTESQVLALEGTRWMVVMGSGEFDRGRMAGLFFRFGVGTAAAIVARLRSNGDQSHTAVAGTLVA